MSCNYCISKDGKIALIVPEDERSACTSSVANDNRAITIEMSCDLQAPYKVTQAAYDSLVSLLVDICKRRPELSGLRWRGDSKLIGQPDKQNMTVHRWFANKSCPGDYLYSKHPEIVAEVNQILRESESKAPVSDSLYRVQVGAFKDKANAEGYCKAVQNAGFPAFVLEVIK